MAIIPFPVLCVCRTQLKRTKTTLKHKQRRLRLTKYDKSYKSNKLKKSNDISKEQMCDKERAAEHARHSTRVLARAS